MEMTTYDGNAIVRSEIGPFCGMDSHLLVVPFFGAAHNPRESGDPPSYHKYVVHI